MLVLAQGRANHTLADYELYVKGLDEKKKLAESGMEYWLGRDLMPLLEYDEWRNFRSVIDKAICACRSANLLTVTHFVETNKMVLIGSGAERLREDWFLTRYACYLIAMNADPSKVCVGYAQTYFAVQTRNQEISTQQHRLRLRLRVIDATKHLNSTARRSGVERFPLFHDAGYRGLYGGRGLSEIKRYKRLKDKDDLLDRAGRAELAANEFRLTQADQKIVRECITGEESLIAAHRNVGLEVRSSIDRMGGIMPEDLPPEPSIRPLINQHRKQVLNGSDQPAA